jgi:hypothetical protein
MEDLKRRNISLINLAYSNTLIITGQQAPEIENMS